MNQWKWLLISLGLVVAASFGMLACGDDNEKTKCTSNDDCTNDGEICSPDTGNCEVACSTAGEECDPENSEVCSDTCGKTPGICFIPCKTDGDCLADVETCDLTFCGTTGGLCVPVKTTACTTNAECTAADTVCDPVSSTCIDKCTSNTDCDAVAACNATTGLCVLLGAECIANADCGEDRVCTDNKCEAAPDNICTDQGDCYAKAGNLFCAATTPTNTCVDTACGVSFNDCSRCSKGPNAGNRDTGAPEIFSASQVKISGSSSGRNCKNDLSQCESTSAPLVCEFTFFAFSPTASELPTPTAKDPHVWVLNGSGVQSTPFGVKKTEEGGNAKYSFRACFPEGGGNSVGTAAFLTSTTSTLIAAGKPDAGKPATGRSNTLCTVGSK